MSVGFASEAVGRPKKQDRPAEPLKPKTVGVRASGEWAAWADRYAKFRRVDVAKLIDLALAELAKGDGFEPPPDRKP
jgi:hypothetical protein